MNRLKYTLFWTGIYLAVIFVFGLTDNMSSPIIDFASYFYLTVMIAFPVTLFFPSISRFSLYVPMLVWGGVYLVIMEVIDRAPSTRGLEYPVIVLEFLLLELGVWIAFRLATQISLAESFLDALALGAFPSRASYIDQEHQRIKVEFARSRRYVRPLSLVAIETESEDQKSMRELLKNIQTDLTHRFKAARVGQIIDDFVRQTDLIMKDQRGRYAILCPETDRKNAVLLAQRISRTVHERADIHILWGVATFPDDALAFDDLLHKSREKLTSSLTPAEPEASPVNV